MYSKNKLIIFFIFLLFLIVPTNILASGAVSIISFPPNKIAGEEFEVQFSGVDLAVGGSYYMKGLGGSVGSSLTEVDTWNGSWLQQNTSWDLMPTFVANSEGSASATLKVRFDPSVITETKEFKVRIRKTDGTTNIDSSSVNISIIAATPQPTFAPTAQPTTAPTNAPTSRPSPTRTATPRATATPTPAPTPIGSGQAESVETNEPTEVLGTSTNTDQTPTPKSVAVDDSTKKKLPLLAIIFVIAGISCLGYVGYLLYNMNHQNDGRNAKNSETT